MKLEETEREVDVQSNLMTRTSKKLNLYKYKFKKNFQSQASLFLSKPPMIVLLWNLLVFGYEIITVIIIWRSYGNTYNWSYIVSAVFIYYGLAMVVFYPLAGWLADVYFGRYVVIKFSMILMWISSLLLLINRIIYSIGPSDLADFEFSLIFIVLSINLVAFSGFHVNIIVYGIEQMPDAPTEQIKTFINWYYWTRNAGLSFTSLFAFIICNSSAMYDNGTIFQYLSSTLCVSLALGSEFLFGHHLNKNHRKTNPFSLIRRVIMYSIKHKYPENRSALTYNESYQPKRIDYGKNIYGGPYTCDEVESVKTFLHMLKAMFAIGLFYFLYTLVSLVHQCNISNT